jgi:HD superfamily phosphohydrolase
MICYPEKMVPDILNLFKVRFDMHQKVYTHKTVKAIEYMLTDALVLADPYIKFQGI